MGLKGLRFLGILIATFLLISSEVAATELAETPTTKDEGGTIGPRCYLLCCRGRFYGGPYCCCPHNYAGQEGRHAKP